jgi:hypothetical protein
MITNAAKPKSSAATNIYHTAPIQPYSNPNQVFIQQTNRFLSSQTFHRQNTQKKKKKKKKKKTLQETKPTILLQILNFVKKTIKPNIKYNLFSSLHPNPAQQYRQLRQLPKAPKQ